MKTFVIVTLSICIALCAIFVVWVLRLLRAATKHNGVLEESKKQQ